MDELMLVNNATTELTTLTLLPMPVVLIVLFHVVVTELLIQLAESSVILEFQLNSALLTAHTQFAAMVW
jgi:hypothetical protein